MNYEVVVFFTLLIILISLQHTLNKIFLELKEIKEILKRKS